MTVEELITKLQAIKNKDKEVILACTPEEYEPPDLFDIGFILEEEDSIFIIDTWGESWVDVWDKVKNEGGM